MRATLTIISILVVIFVVGLAPAMAQEDWRDYESTAAPSCDSNSIAYDGGELVLLERSVNFDRQGYVPHILMNIPSSENRVVYCMTLSPDEQFLAVGTHRVTFQGYSDDYEIYVLDLVNGGRTNWGHAENHFSHTPVWNPNEEANLVFIYHNAATNGRIVKIDISSSNLEIETVLDEQVQFFGLTISADGEWLFSVGSVTRYMPLTMYALNLTNDEVYTTRVSGLWRPVDLTDEGIIIKTLDWCANGAGNIDLAFSNDQHIAHILLPFDFETGEFDRASATCLSREEFEN